METSVGSPAQFDKCRTRVSGGRIGVVSKKPDSVVTLTFYLSP